MPTIRFRCRQYSLSTMAAYHLAPISLVSASTLAPLNIAGEAEFGWRCDSRGRASPPTAPAHGRLMHQPARFRAHIDSVDRRTSICATSPARYRRYFISMFIRAQTFRSRWRQKFRRIACRLSEGALRRSADAAAAISPVARRCR